MSNSVDGDPLDNTGPLTRIFKAGPLQQWPVENIVKDKLMRFAQTYLLMASPGRAE